MRCSSTFGCATSSSGACPRSCRYSQTLTIPSSCAPGSGAILDAYGADITRYVKDRVRARQIEARCFDAVPSQLNKESKRFIISGATDGKRFSRIASDFDWLADAGVVIPVHRATEATFPLGLSEERSYFKRYQSDVGLLFATFPSTAVEQLLARSEDMNLGAVFENAVAQELRAHGHERLYYFNKRGVGEVDFHDRRSRRPIRCAHRGQVGQELEAPRGA